MDSMDTMKRSWKRSVRLRRPWGAGAVLLVLLLDLPGTAAQGLRLRSEGISPPVTLSRASTNRVERLLRAMTPGEKRSLIHDARENPSVYQGQAGYVAGVPRLGVPGLRLADGPPGVLTRHPAQAETATMGLAATFDLALARHNGEVIGRDARALGIDVALQPFINIDRDLAFRRAYNTYGEDPLLTSLMGAALIDGIQSQGVMAMAKHYIGFDTAATDVWIDQQALHEVYLAPFDAAVKAGVASVMCAYNHINGPYACGNRDTLHTMLRKELGFDGFVTSDWGAVHSAQFLRAGLDLEMIDGPDSKGYQEPAFLGAEAAALPPPQSENGETLGDIYGGSIPEERVDSAADESDLGAKVVPETLADALRSGTLTDADVTASARRVLRQMARFGLLDGRSRHGVTTQAVETNARVIRQTAGEAAVLLKNEDRILPLRAADLDSVVLIGPTAAQVDAIGINGERSMGLPDRQIGPLEALRRISVAQNIQFAVADDMTGAPIPAELYSHGGSPGLQRSTVSGLQTDTALDFTLKGRNALPPNTRATWTGTLTVAVAGNYWLYLQALGTDASLYVDGKRVGITGTFQGDVHGDILQANQDNVVPTVDGLDNVRQALDLAAGPHALRVEISPDTSNAPVQVRLNWYPPEQRQADYDAAIAAAAHAKVAVVFAWARREPAFALPGDQNQMIEQIAAVNPHTIVVLNTSQPVALPWLDRVRAVLEMWWPGDEGGWATADLLLGKLSPAGRLPVTWARDLQDYPANDPHFPERSAAGAAQRTTFSEGVNVGYRWFDQRGIAPSFPFGHGLSYTDFAYTGLTLSRARDGGLDVGVRIRNLTRIAGDEVPQVYLGAPAVAPDGVQYPLRRLVAFTRVYVAPEASTRVTMHVPLRQLQYWSTADSKWKTLLHGRSISVGASSRDLRVVGKTDAISLSP